LGRVKKDQTSGSTYDQLYWYGTSSDPLIETDLAGVVTDEYIFFGGKRVARRQSSGTIHYYFSDHLGSSRVVTSDAGAILDDSDYYPFGGERVVVASTDNPYLFTGKERDTESGLDYFGARYYSSGQGRFLSVDPSGRSVRLTNPQTWNRYGYVLNSPLRYVDPNGKWPTETHNRIIDDVFKGIYNLDDRSIWFLKYASERLDTEPGGQDSRNAYKHAMSDGLRGQSAGEAAQLAGEFVDAQLNQAVDAQLKWESRWTFAEPGWAPDAMLHFGNALHTVTDNTSPQHQGFQAWHGMGLTDARSRGFNFARATVHFFRETYSARNDANALANARVQAVVLWQTFQRKLEEAREAKEKEEEKKASESKKED